MPKGHSELLNELYNLFMTLEDVSFNLANPAKVDQSTKEMIKELLKQMHDLYKRLIENTGLDQGFHFLDDLEVRIDTLVNKSIFAEIYSELHQPKSIDGAATHPELTEEQGNLFNDLVLVDQQLRAVKEATQNASCKDPENFTRHMKLACEEFKNLISLLQKEMNKKERNIQRIKQLANRAICFFDDIVKKGMDQLPVNRDSEASFYPA